MAKTLEYALSSRNETGFVVATCRDKDTGLIVRTPLASTDRSFPAFVAYVGAKFSRSRGGMIQLMTEIQGAYKDGVLTPERRLGNIVHGLKHQSPGGMAHVAVSIENVPLITVASLFRRTVLYDGQEASTRYIDFASGNNLPELSTLLPSDAKVTSEIKELYTELQRQSLEMYQHWFLVVYDAYRDHFQVNDTDPKEKSALTARAYDTVRGFLLSGFKTSMIYVTNATTMQQMLSDFGAGRLPSEKNLAETVLNLLAPQKTVSGYRPEIMPLLNHVEPNYSTRNEQAELVDFFNRQPGFDELLKAKRSFDGLVDNNCQLISDAVSPTDRLIAQQIMVINPALNLTDVVTYVEKLNDEQRASIGKIIFFGRDRFTLPAIAASGNNLGLHLKIDLGIERDLGRHRAWDRVSPIHETYTGFGEIGETGFVQVAYLRQIPEMATISQGMESDMLSYYEKRSQFLDKLRQSVGTKSANEVGMYLLPLAHQVDMVMNGDIRNMIYLQDIRIREGVHIDARLIIASANRQVADRDSLYSSLAYSVNRVLIDDRAQFLSRD